MKDFVNSQVVPTQAYEQDDNMGFGHGNRTLDTLLKHFVEDAKDCYFNGVPSRHGRFYIVLIRLEGDLPAQAKLSHSGRNFTNDPNPMCPWCLADGKETPYGDFRRNADWRATISLQPPWSSWSPLHDLPGGEDERFLSKDLFHISHLGISRTCVASVICFLVTIGHFQPWEGGTSVPACLQEAYKEFSHYCKAVLHETPDVKAFTRENLHWKSRAKMPETSWCLASSMYILLLLLLLLLLILSSLFCLLSLLFLSLSLSSLLLLLLYET